MWVFENGTFVPAAKITKNEQYTIVTDYLGTPIQMYDEQGEKTWDCTLDVYGKVANFEGSSLSDCPFRYQGQYEDGETGLYYNRFRFFDPSTGMYVSQDPIGLAGGISLYSYVNDVNLWLDYWGLSTVYLRNKEIYVGKAKQSAKTRYSNSNIATDIFTDIPKTNVAQGVEQIVYERMKNMEANGDFEGVLGGEMTNINRPVNMNDKKKAQRRSDGEEWLRSHYGDDYGEIIDNKVKRKYDLCS